MVLPAATAAAQQAYTSPLQQKSENLVRNPEQRPEDSNNQPLPATTRPPVENIEDSTRNNANRQNLDLAAENIATGNARSETQERGSLIDISA